VTYVASKYVRTGSMPSEPQTANTPYLHVHTWKMSDTASLNTLLWERGRKPWNFRWGPDLILHTSIRPRGELDEIYNLVIKVYNEGSRRLFKCIKILIVNYYLLSSSHKTLLHSRSTVYTPAGTSSGGKNASASTIPQNCLTSSLFLYVSASPSSWTFHHVFCVRWKKHPWTDTSEPNTGRQVPIQRWAFQHEAFERTIALKSAPVYAQRLHTY